MNHQDNLTRVNSNLDSILGQGAEILAGTCLRIFIFFSRMSDQSSFVCVISLKGQSNEIFAPDFF